MAFNFGNLRVPQSVEQGILLARQKGYSDEQIQNYLAPKLQKINQETADVESGLLEPSNVTSSSRELLRTEGFTKENADEKEEKVALGDLSEKVDLLEQNYQQIESRGPVSGRVGGLLSNVTGGAINPEVADYEALRQALISPVARIISKEKGTLTDKDIERAEKLLPKVSDSAQLVKNKLNNLRTLLGEKTDESEKAQGETKPQNLSSTTVAAQGEVSSAGDVQGLQETAQSQESMDLLNRLLGGATQVGLSGFLANSGFNPGVASLLEKIGLGSISNIPAAEFEGARALSTKVAEATGQPVALSGQNPFISQDKQQRMQEDPVRQIVGEGASGLAYAVPFGKGAGVLSKVLAPGAAVGALNAVSEIEEGKDVDVGDIAKGALLGAGLSWGIDKTGKALSVAGKKLAGKAPDFVNQLFRPTQSSIEKFRRNTGLEFADEVIKRDIDDIQGMSGPEILAFYEDKVGDLANASDEFLYNFQAETGKTVDKQKILDSIDDVIKSREGRVLQSSAQEQLQTLKNELQGIDAGDLDLTFVNKVKKDLQLASRAAYGPSGTSSPTSNALADVARKINDVLETTAPGIKDVNKDIQFYRLARDSIQKSLDRASRSQGGGLVQRLLVGGGQIGAGAALLSGNPALAAAAASPSVANAILSSPQFKTQAASRVPSLSQQQISPAVADLIRRLGVNVGTRF